MAVRDMVALRIDVGLDEASGHAKYPAFNKITPATRKNMDWAKYLDIHGSGMHYDKLCGHQDEGDTPYGHQCCCICVPADFAAEALALFPDQVTAMTAAEFEAFYDTKAHVHEAENHVDTDVLNGLNSQRSLMLSLGQDVSVLDARIAKALDPTDTTERGVRKNINRKWADVKVKKGINVI